eukprot:351382_1
MTDDYVINNDDEPQENDQQNNIGKKWEIIQNIAWGFSYLTGFDKFREELISKMNELGIIKQFINVMSHKHAQLRHAIIRLIGNILTGTSSESHTRACLDLGILGQYKYILTKINNITATEQRQ